MEIKRNIYTHFDRWRESQDRKPLLLRGARQVGKSYAVRTWAKKAFGAANCFEINLEERPDLRGLFAKNLVVDRIISELQIISGFDFHRENVLFFIDEIQTCPEAITSLRYFAEKMPQLAVIAAGSLIDFVLEKISFPVGRIQSIFMYPLSFYEFLIGLEKAHLVDYLKKLPLNMPVIASVHDEILADLRLYSRVGGMPEVAASYFSNRSLARVSEIQQRLLVAYEDDFAKYAPHSDWEALSIVFNKAPFFVGSNRIKYSKFSDLLRGEKIKKALLLLEKAQLLSFVFGTYAHQLPLKSGIKHEVFKLLFLDVGLLQRSLGFDWTAVSPSDELSSLYEGVFAEQFVGQEMLANADCAARANLFYWLRLQKGAEAELDYLIEYDRKPTPLEVKSGNKGSLKSLFQYSKEFNPKQSFVASSRNIETLDNTTWIPLYLVGRL